MRRVGSTRRVAASAVLACAAVLALSACTTAGPPTSHPTNAPTPRPSGGPSVGPSVGPEGSVTITTIGGAGANDTPEQAAVRLLVDAAPAVATSVVKLSAPGLEDTPDAPLCTGAVHFERLWIVYGASVSGLADERATAARSSFDTVSRTSDSHHGQHVEEVTETRSRDGATLVLTMAQLSEGGVGLRADAFVPRSGSAC